MGLVESISWVNGDSYDTMPLPQIESLRDVARLSAYDAVRVYDNGHFEDNVLALTAIATAIVGADCAKSTVVIKQGSGRKYGKVANQIFAQISYTQPGLIPLMNVSEDELIQPYLDSVKNMSDRSGGMSPEEQRWVKRLKASF